MALPESETAARPFAIGFLTALVSAELIPFQGVLAKKGWSPVVAEQRYASAGISQWKKNVHGHHVTAFSMAISKMGQALSAVETATFLARTRCSFVVLSGIAGSLKRDEVKKRDVVIGQRVFWRGQNRVSAGKDCVAAGAAKTSGECCDIYRASNYETYSYDADLDRNLQLHYARAYPQQRESNLEKESFSVHFADILSWDYVLSHKRIVSEFNKSIPSAACVEMEAGGFRESLNRYSKTQGERPMFGFVVRGISDYADHKDSDTPTRIAASGNAAIVGIDLAESFFDKYGLNLINLL